MPISLKIEPSAMCQLACPGCPQSNPLFKIQTRGKTMSLELFRRIIEEAGRYLYRIQFYDYGEPFINKRLLQMISIATEHGIGSQVSSNFSFNFSNDFYRSIVESGLEHLIIAMDGLDPATYSQYRVHGKYELVEAGMRAIIDWKRRLGRQTPFVEWQFIVFDHNRHQVDAVKTMARRIGVDRLCLKYDARAESKTWYTADRLTDKTVRSVRLNSCLWLWGAMLISSDGIVSPCCNAGHSENIGDLTTTPLANLWNSPRMMELRACVRGGGRSVADGMEKTPCHGCAQIF
jgi:MoaA/NifB/PqqE/SkfB family radical SAM enzyme